MSAISGPRVRFMLLPILVLAMAFASGCGDDGDEAASDSETSSSGELTPLTVATTTLTEGLALHVADAEGYFKEEGLDVKIVPSASGAEIVPSVASGDADLGRGNIVTFLQAVSQGVDIKIVGESASTAPADAGLFVAPDSGIESVQDLSGKTVAVNSLGGISDLLIQESLDDRGVDPDSYRRIALNFPDQGPALEQGRIDAAFAPEPFQSSLLAAGNDRILAPFEGSRLGGMPAEGYIATSGWIEDNRSTLEAFLRAVHRASDYLQADVQHVKDGVVEFTEIPAKVAKGLDFSKKEWTTYPDVRALQQVADVMTDYDFLPERIDAAEIVEPTKPQGAS